MAPNSKPTIVTTVSRAGSGSGETTIVTPPGRPDIILKVLDPFVVVGVRALRVFLQTLIGLVTAGITAPNALPAKDFLHLLTLCASLALAPAIISVIQSVIELLGKFDQSHPTLTS